MKLTYGGVSISFVLIVFLQLALVIAPQLIDVRRLEMLREKACSTFVGTLYTYLVIILIMALIDYAKS